VEKRRYCASGLGCYERPDHAAQSSPSSRNPHQCLISPAKYVVVKPLGLADPDGNGIRRFTFFADLVIAAEKQRGPRSSRIAQHGTVASRL
jgi:hypothetical protein